MGWTGQGRVRGGGGAICRLGTDVGAYRAYDQDEEHDRARVGLLPMMGQIAGVQFEMP